MEKIYIEEKQKNNKKLHLSISVGLSFAVAFVAMFSILFISLSGTSYAAPSVTTLPTSFTTKTTEFAVVDYNGDDGYYDTPIFTAENVDSPVFCVESAREFANNTLYTRDGEINDEGFIYLLSKLSALDVKDADIVAGSTLDTSIGLSKSQIVKSWIKQTAIWAYLGRAGGIYSSTASDIYKNAGVVNDLASKASVKFYAEDASIDPVILSIADSSKIYAKYGVANIINTALSYKFSTTVLTVKATKASGNFGEPEGGYMKSPEVTVNVNATGGITTNPTTYSVSLGNAPEGTKVKGVKSNGQEVELSASDLNAVSISAYQGLYVYVPANKVTETVTFSLTIKANFKVYTGYYYKTQNSNDQRIITIDLVDKPKSSSVEFTLTPTPDTGVNVSKLMYIVGMIVLLSGLGILYVNIKNQKQYQ